MARTVNYRLQTGPGAWVRASGELPFDITGLSNGEIYEVDIGDGVLLERTPTAPPLSDPVTFVKSAEVINVTSGAFTHTSAGFTPDGGADHMLILAVQANMNNAGADMQQAAATWNGSPMTRRLVRQSGTGTRACGVVIFDIPNPGSGAGTFVVSLFATDGVTPDNVSSISAVAVELSGVDVAAPFGATDGSTTNAIHTITATDADAMILTTAVAAFGISTGPYAPQAGFTEIQDSQTGTANFASLRAFTGYGNFAPGVVSAGGVLAAGGTLDSSSASVEYLPV